MKINRAFKPFGKLCVAILPMLCAFVPAIMAKSEEALIGENIPTFSKVKEVYKKNAPAVVKVFAAKKDDEGKQFLLVGSGFFADKQGHIITNATIVYKADNLWIEAKGIPFKANLVGLDPITNLSVLKLEANEVDFPFVDLESSSRLPEIADSLLMISCELGQDVSPRMGLITGHNINFGEKILPTVYLRTSIPIYGGSVGAPIFSLDGEFQGMSVATLPELGGSFVLPARAVNRIKDDILLAQKVAYGWFGLVSREISDNVNGVRVIVDIVVPKGPAEKAGFLAGDVILSINGKKLSSDRDLRWETFFIKPGELANFRVRRGEVDMDLELQVSRMEKFLAEAQLNSAQKANASKEDAKVD